MCQFASFILTKNKVYWSSNSESHEEIIRENGLEELDGEAPNIVRVEILPNEESLSDLDTWKFVLDQDKFPAWTFEGDPELEERTRKGLKRRAREEKWFKEETGQNVFVGFHGTAKAGFCGTAKAGDEGTAEAGDDGTAIAGFHGTAKAGDYGTVSAGYYGTAEAGIRGTAIAGYEGTAKTGHKGTAKVGDYGTAKAGYYGTAKAGDYGTAIAGYEGTAIAGHYGTAISGFMGTAKAGNKGTAQAGNKGTAQAGSYGTASAGEGGKIMIDYYDSERNRMRTLIGYVGEDGIKPNVPYVVKDGKLVKK
jgi:hypothetical protein